MARRYQRPGDASPADLPPRKNLRPDRDAGFPPAETGSGGDIACGTGMGVGGSRGGVDYGILSLESAYSQRGSVDVRSDVGR
jgi:hypothetical protein